MFLALLASCRHRHGLEDQQRQHHLASCTDTHVLHPPRHLTGAPGYEQTADTASPAQWHCCSAGHVSHVSDSMHKISMSRFTNEAPQCHQPLTQQSTHQLHKRQHQQTTTTPDKPHKCFLNGAAVVCNCTPTHCCWCCLLDQEFGKTKIYIPKQEGLQVLSKEVRGTEGRTRHGGGGRQQGRDGHANISCSIRWGCRDSGLRDQEGSDGARDQRQSC